MKKWGGRILALSIAGLFLLTSVGFSALVIWQANQKNDDQAASQQDDQTNSQEGKLQGTQLADFTPLSKVDSLQKIDTQPGTGAEVKATDTVTVHYTGAVATTGKIFQSSLDFGQPVSFPLNQVLKGWTEGIPGMKVGGKRRLLIPAALAYGATPPQGSGIPANADLIFDVELVKIGQ